MGAANSGLESFTASSASPSQYGHGEATSPYSCSEGTQRSTNVDAAVQVELEPGFAAVEERRQLLVELEDVRVERAVLEKRSKIELRDLRALLLARPDDGGADDETIDEADAASADADDDADAEPAELHYVQRIEELEHGTETLKGDLDHMHTRERHLREELKEKNELIANLMRKAKLTDLDGVGPAVEATQQPFWKSAWSAMTRHSTEDLQQVIEDVTEDNIRLRNDVQIMAEGLRKALTERT